jgi:pyruvate dehydrogenase E1 component
VRDDLLRGLYRLQAFGSGPAKVRLLGSGAILREVLKAARVLHEEHGIANEVFSATSYSELAREARELQRQDRSEPLSPAQGRRRLSHVQRLLAGDAPIVAASDYVRAWPQLITEYVSAKLVTLGTDGFGRSDTRQALRRYFEVDAQAVVAAALEALRPV